MFDITIQIILKIVLVLEYQCGTEADPSRDAEARIGVAGDWCDNGRTDGAFRSGNAVAKKIIQAHGAV